MDTAVYDLDKLDKEYTSDFNEAKYQILRLNNSWNNCNIHRRRGELIKWKWELDTIWDELSSKCKKKGKVFNKIAIKTIDYLDKKILSSIIKKTNINMYNFLREKQRYLKYIQDEVGMGGKMSTDDEDDIEE